MTQVQVGKLVGKMRVGEWGMVHDFVPSDEGRRRRRGRLIVVADLDVDTSEGEVGVVATGREVLGRLHELYYAEGGEGASEEGGLETLKGVVGKVVEEFGGGEIAGIVVREGVVYVAVTAGMGVWVRRKQGEGWLVGSRRGEEGGKVAAFSGRVEEGVVLVVGEGRFWERVGEGVLKAALGNLNEEGGLETAVEALAAVEHGGEGGVGAVIRVEGGEEEREVGTEEEAKEEPMRVKEERSAGGLGEKAKKRMGGRRWWDEVRERWGGKKQVFVVRSGDPERSRKRVRYAAAAFLVLVAVFFGGGRLRGKWLVETRSQTRERTEAIYQKYTEAKALVGLNPARSRQLLAEVEEAVGGLSEGEKKERRMVEMLSEMGEVLGAASGKKEVAVVEVADLGLVREGVRAERLVRGGGGGKLWVLDGEGERVMEVDAVRKSVKVVAGKADLGEVREMGGGGERWGVVSEKGVVVCEGESGECEVAVKPEEGGWGEVRDVGLWAGNVYVLDGGARNGEGEVVGQIWKYSALEAGWGEKKGWVAEPDGSLRGGRGMVIDGSIWVATKVEGGTVEIAKYTQGVRENLRVVGLDEGWGEKVELDTESEGERLYVLDMAKGRVVAIVKETGEYDGQWVNEKMKEAADLVVDEGAGKIYLVAGKYVWEAGM